MRIVFIFFISFLLISCVTVSDRGKEIRNIKCEYEFKQIKPEDVDEIETIIKSVASGKVYLSKPYKNKQCSFLFYVDSIDDIKILHNKLLFEEIKTYAEFADVHKVVSDPKYNYREPEFQITYSTLDLSASIEVKVTFKVESEPGAKLYYKFQNDNEEDITDKMDSNGFVSFHTKIEKGQEYIYAKLVKGDVKQFIRINVFSQESERISEMEYNRSGDTFNNSKKDNDSYFDD